MLDIDNAELDEETETENTETEDSEDSEDSEDTEDSEEIRPNESKNEKFQRLAERRTNKVLFAISKIGMLSNRLNYQYSQEEVELMFSAIEEDLQLVKEQFSTTDKQIKRFSFH